jgi:hypothetical protein
MGPWMEGLVVFLKGNHSTIIKMAGELVGKAV